MDCTGCCSGGAVRGGGVPLVGLSVTETSGGGPWVLCFLVYFGPVGIDSGRMGGGRACFEVGAGWRGRWCRPSRGG